MTDIFVIGLAGLTLVAVIIFALTSKWRTERKLADPDAPKSALAKDGPMGSIEERT
ncbi:MAG: hypothetical protein AAF919_00320 [Pseudomonadota bacterium]